MKSRNSGLQGSARTSEKYGDKWSMTESKIDGSCGKTAGTPDAGSKDTCVDVEIHRHAEIQYLSGHRETLSTKGMTTNIMHLPRNYIFKEEKPATHKHLLGFYISKLLAKNNSNPTRSFVRAKFTKLTSKTSGIENY